MSEVLNANPTIRNISDLPSRRRQTSPHSSKQHTLGLFASTVPVSAYAPDPFEPSTSSDEEVSDDEHIVEPIDEQEIYGESRALIYAWTTGIHIHMSNMCPGKASLAVSMDILWKETC